MIDSAVRRLIDEFPFHAASTKRRSVKWFSIKWRGGRRTSVADVFIGVLLDIMGNLDFISAM
jgi:hypothetical protein